MESKRKIQTRIILRTLFYMALINFFPILWSIGRPHFKMILICGAFNTLLQTLIACVPFDGRSGIADFLMPKD